jgi:hypothetical protein
VANAGNSYLVQGVTLSTVTLPANTMTFSSNGESVAFTGLYQPVSDIYSQFGGAADIYYVKASSLQKADAATPVALKSFSAYFKDTNPAQTKTTVTVDGTPTAIHTATVDPATSGPVYDLSGRRIQRQRHRRCTAKGRLHPGREKVYREMIPFLLTF